MEDILQFASFLSASAGAILATISIKRAPDEILVRVEKRGGIDFFGSDLEDLLLSLSQQSKYAVRAAFLAALAAVFQFLAYISS